VTTRRAIELWPARGIRTAEHCAWFQAQVMDRYGLSGKVADAATLLRTRSEARERQDWEDHCKVFYRDRRPVLLTSEPYGLGHAAIAQLLTFAQEHTLDVSIDAASPHSRGLTVLVMLWKRGEREAITALQAAAAKLEEEGK
jgi:hypothetical protein